MDSRPAGGRFHPGRFYTHCVGVSDDAGIENFGFYGLRPNPLVDPPYAITEELDLLVPQGTLFTNAWSNPNCSPTRAAFHTGRFGFRTGIGDVILDDDTYGLDVTDPDLLPRLLAGTSMGTTAYLTDLYGKWHRGTSAAQDNENAPRAAGYGHFWGLLLDQQPQPFTELDAPFFHFVETRFDFTQTLVSETFDADLDGDSGGPFPLIYNSRHFTDRVIAAINSRTGASPWFAYVPYLAPHGPWGCPLSGPGTPYPATTFECDATPGAGDDGEFRSMIQAVDIEIGRLLAGIDWDPAETLLVIASDNGSPAARTHDDPFDPARSKGTVGQGGVRVPLLVVGPGVRADERVDEPVHLIDLYATILDFAEKAALIPSDTDSLSLKGLLLSGAPLERDFNYTEGFFPNFEPTDPQAAQHGPCRGSQAVAEHPANYLDATYKYVRLFGGSQEAVYDLDTDPFESDNLLDDPTPPPAARVDALRNHIDLTLGSDLESLCRDKLPTGSSCTSDDQCCSGICGSLGCLCPL